MEPKEPISNESFIEWAKGIFSEQNCPWPRKFYVYSEEARQTLISWGYPVEYITVLSLFKEDEGKVVEIVLPKEYEGMEILCPNCNSDDTLKTKEGYVCARCDFEFKIKIDEARSNS